MSNLSLFLLGLLIIDIIIITLIIIDYCDNGEEEIE